jgi:hypothetical protein
MLCRQFPLSGVVGKFAPHLAVLLVSGLLIACGGGGGGGGSTPPPSGGGGTNPPPASVAVTGVSLNTTTLTLEVGSNQMLTATVAPANATNKALTWSSSNIGIATVSNAGLVTAIAAGATTITVTTTDGNKTAAAEVTVTALPPPPPVAMQAQVSTLAGSGDFGLANGTGTAAQFWLPTGVAVDGAGNVYVADFANNGVRKITPAGAVSRLAGNASGINGNNDGLGEAARFAGPARVAVDAAGNVFVADQYNNSIRKISPAGAVSTFAGSAAGFNQPYGVAVDVVNTIYVADMLGYRIRRITLDGEVWAVAGSPPGALIDGPAATAKFLLPRDVAVDAAGNLYVADQTSHRIRKITPDGMVSTLAGSTQGLADGVVTTVAGSGPTGSNLGDFADGAGDVARFNEPQGVAVASDGSLVVADTKNNRVRRVTFSSP